MTYTAENWPIACAMLAFGNKDSQGGPIQDATAEEWAKHLRDARRTIHVAGFAILDVGILAGFQQGGQERVFAPKSYGDHQVGAVHHRHETRFH